MVGLAKPDTGWIQLFEANLVGWAESKTFSLPALRRAKQTTEDFSPRFRINTRSHKSLGRWLKEAVALDIEVNLFEYKVDGNTKLGRRNGVEFLGTQKVVTAEWKMFEHSAEEYATVIRELEQVVWD